MKFPHVHAQSRQLPPTQIQLAPTAGQGRLPGGPGPLSRFLENLESVTGAELQAPAVEPHHVAIDDPPSLGTTTGHDFTVGDDRSRT